MYIEMSFFPLWRYPNKFERTPNSDDVLVEANRASSNSVMQEGPISLSLQILKEETTKADTMMLVVFILTLNG